MPDPISNPDDDELLERAVRGSESALSTLFDRYGSELYGLARLLAVDPDDVLVEAFSDVVARLASAGAGHGSVRARLVAAVRRRALAQTRARGKKLKPWPGSAGPMENSLRQLGVSEREAVQLAAAGLTEAQMGERLEEAPAVIRQRIRSGMEKLREVLSRPAGA